MKNLKRATETKNTFTMVFDISNRTEERLKNLKALAIVLGGFNPLRREMLDEEKMLTELDKIEENCEIENLLFPIATLLK